MPVERPAASAVALVGKAATKPFAPLGMVTPTIVDPTVRTESALAAGEIAAADGADTDKRAGATEAATLVPTEAGGNMAAGDGVTVGDVMAALSCI